MLATKSEHKRKGDEEEVSIQTAKLEIWQFTFLIETINYLQRTLFVFVETICISKQQCENHASVWKEDPFQGPNEGQCGECLLSLVWLPGVFVTKKTDDFIIF